MEIESWKLPTKKNKAWAVSSAEFHQTFKETLANTLETCPKLQEGTFHNSLWFAMKENTLNNVSNKFINLQKKVLSNESVLLLHCCE